MKEKLAKSDAENDRLKLENERLHKRMQKMALPVSNYNDFPGRDRYDPQNPLDQFQYLEPKLAPHSVQVAELTDRLEQTETKLQHTQTELHKTKVELKQMQEKVHI